MSQPPTADQVYAQYQSVVEQLRILDDQLANVNSVIIDLESSLDTVDGLNKNSANEEVIIPLGGLISLRCTLSGKKELMVSLGSGVIAPLSLEQAKEHITKRRTDMLGYRSKLVEDQQKLSEIAQNLSNILNQTQSNTP